MSSFTPPPPRSDLKWIGVDFDGTICQTEYPEYRMGEPILDAVAKVHKYAFLGWKIAIHTSRPSADYEAIEAWLNHYGVPFHRIVTGKLLCKAYVDDRNVRPEDEEWV